MIRASVGWLTIIVFLFLLGVVDKGVSKFPGRTRSRKPRGGGGGFVA